MDIYKSVLVSKHGYINLDIIIDRHNYRHRYNYKSAWTWIYKSMFITINTGHTWIL